VSVVINLSPASAGVTSARPRVSASTFPCVERWTRLAAFDGWPSPNRTLPTSGCLLSPREHRPTGSSRLPALTRATRAAATHARESVRTYLPEAPSVVVVTRDHRVSPVLAIETLLLPGLFGAKLRAPLHQLLTPAIRVSGRTVGLRLDPRVLSARRRCVRLDFCFPLPSIEHPRLVCSR
jgi:hypothetical protein